MARYFTLLMGFICLTWCKDVFSQGIVGTTSVNGMQIIYQDTFHSSSLDLTGSPRDLTKWTKSGSASNPVISSATTWYSVGTYNNKGYEYGSNFHLSQAININQDVTLWSPQISFPNEDRLWARIAIRCASWVGGGTWTIGVAFDGNNDQVADATPAMKTTVFTGAGPYNDYSGLFPTGLGSNLRLIQMDISDFRNRTGRLGIYIRHQSLTSSQTYLLDWFVVGTRPLNDLCQDAIQLTNGSNGGANGYYNAVATGLIPSTNASGFAANFQGGQVIYVGNGTPDGRAEVPQDASSRKDGYEPPAPGPLSPGTNTVENSIWFKFRTPVSTSCSAGQLQVRVTFQNLECAAGNTTGTYTEGLQARFYQAGLCGTNTPFSDPAINVNMTGTYSPILNNAAITTNVTGGLAYNTEYYLLVDGYTMNDCRFNIFVETLLSGAVQSSPCIVQSPVLLPVTLAHFEANCFNNYKQISWAASELMNATQWTLQKSTNLHEWTELKTFTPSAAQNFSFFDFEQDNQVSYYRIQQKDLNGNIEYSQIVHADCNPMPVVEIFPNPFTSSILLKNAPIGAHVMLTNELGETILQQTIQKPNLKLDLSHLASGVYFIKIENEKQISTQKIIKK